jgi:outer membrane protein TolC
MAYHAEGRSLRTLVLLLIPLAARADDPSALTAQRPLPINLATAMSLAGAAPLDIAIAQKRTEAAAADLDRADLLWLPNLSVGGDYFRHDGQLQDIAGFVFSTNRSAVMAGLGPSAVFALSDAYYAPLAARQSLRARRAEEQTARNDAALAAGSAYFEVQRARGYVAGSLEAVKKALDLTHRCEKLSPGLIPDVEVARARTELNRRRYALDSAHEAWQASSAELARILRLDPATLAVPVELPQLAITFVDFNTPIDDLIATGLTHRPELAAHQAAVQATLALLRLERARPFLPSLALRGIATNPASGLAFGVFGGGIGSQVGKFNLRNSLDVQLTWELQALGLGNRALIRRRLAENDEAALRLARLQDAVAAEVVQAQARAARAASRVGIAAAALKDAQETAEKSIEGLGQTKRAGTLLILVIRPQEAIAAVVALDQCYRDYYGAVADYNRAQLHLYRALGHPPEGLLQHLPPPPSGACVAPAPPG